jgi:hypothetical protein
MMHAIMIAPSSTSVGSDALAMIYGQGLLWVYVCVYMCVLVCACWSSVVKLMLNKTRSGEMAPAFQGLENTER